MMLLLFRKLYIRHDFVNIQCMFVIPDSLTFVCFKLARTRNNPWKKHVIVPEKYIRL